MGPTRYYNTIHLPFANDEVDEFLLSHIIEHIHTPLMLMEELHRIAKPGAKMVIAVPYGSSDDAWEDPTHVRPYFINSFSYFGQPNYWRADYQYRGDWRVTKVMLRGVRQPDIPPLDYVSLLRNTVSEMVGVLEAVKPIRAQDKELRESPEVEFIS